jgi:hypothetical protein
MIRRIDQLDQRLPVELSSRTLRKYIEDENSSARSRAVGERNLVKVLGIVQSTSLCNSNKREAEDQAL